MTRLSICIPTFNRAGHLANCLQSIRASALRAGREIEVCISDNGSTDDTAAVVRAAQAQAQMPITYRGNSRNLGIPRNFLNVVAIADGEFVWLLGDDDLVVPDAIDQLLQLIDRHPNIDFFYINSFHLTTEYVLSFPQPFDTADLPADMKPFSSRTISSEMDFLDLVDPAISFDFLGGMFLSVFRREKWMAHTDAISEAALADARVFSTFDNTFPHVKIFARAFAGSKAFFSAKPLSVCLTGAREWAPMYPMVRSVRLVDALNEYRRNGLPLCRYVKCRNFALRTFLPDMAYMYLHRDTSGYQYLDHARLMMSNVMYPNFYLSIVYFFLRKLRAGVMRAGQLARILAAQRS